ncbi:sigma-70 family RNA polymerase sigma factor [Sphingomonas sp. Leaf25]|uniref:sigma-70 family RNA polymerase sigma factor n=1 Tax=Sphingomonas sp. Leaf25 TaxID=1735692 RepID=UPI0006F620D4|nr:sigma-70 family RNA polymerase sigma factor [Sphingomonas sp. Leaf25]KQM97994.1 hypothetical protein ASE78_06900 [Sphingomonas sp. Leaf25]
MSVEIAQLFDEARPKLLGLAYRMVGTYAEAEDVVQDAFARWLAADHDAIENHQGWLTTVCTRRAIDMLRSARRVRTEYVGAWLPEPLHAQTAIDEGEAGSLETALLLALDRLSPRERAAFLLADVFGVSHQQIAETLGIGEVACRKLASRARAKVRDGRSNSVAPSELNRGILATFDRALETGDASELSELLAEHVTLVADGGGKVRAALKPLIGRGAVLDFAAQAKDWWSPYHRSLERMATGEALVIRNGSTVIAVLWVGPIGGDGLADRLYVMRNPAKLGTITSVAQPRSVAVR